jgi:alpha-glucuronidase
MHALIVLNSKANPNIPIPQQAKEKLEYIGNEGYLIVTDSKSDTKIFIIANTDIGVLYGVFGFLKQIQTHQSLKKLDIVSSPKTQFRLMNHWDNMDRTVERGYAGLSLWDWQKLPDYISPRYIDYARANASIGINGTSITNVNANADILKEQYLLKVAALADAFRPYGIKVYLTARFSAPIQLAGLKTADPLDPEVRQWWKDKTDEIYRIIPDFGGFLVKANSEGQPGPQDYNRTHADGANMLAEAVAPHGGIVMWRAFVYSAEVPVDRSMQAYNEFKPLDGQFMKNVFVQVKNGPIDFQPREPFHPLFGAMPGTPLMVEFQLTQEYLGFATHLVYEAPLFKETLDADTYANGQGSLVANSIDGTLHEQLMTGMAAVSNIGTDRNWTGHQFGQANWYAYGRLAWDHTLSAEAIADEWIRMTFSNDPLAVESIKDIMIKSREAVVNYMTPLGLHHQMARGHHYGPGPWVTGGRPDWTSTYYNKADSLGIGFDRSMSGTKALSQYFSPVSSQFDHLSTCPEELLLWFHHVSWDYKMKSGRTLWDELCFKYNLGVEEVIEMRETWESLGDKIDTDRFVQVDEFLKIQEKEAKWWRDACLLYYQTFSKKPIPAIYPQPEHTLEYYEKIDNKYAPGN